jgi:NADH:ubiquinone oxidoreductase subunit 2 (subunit N)
MKVPKAAEGVPSSAALAYPAIIVVLVLVLGATIYLWRARYIRRRTAYLAMLVLVVALAVVGVWMYSNPM